MMPGVFGGSAVRHLLGRLTLFGAIAAVVAACSSPSPTASTPVSPPGNAPPPSLAATQLLAACLVPDNELRQIKTCTQTINSGALSPQELSSALALRGTLYLRLMRLTDARIDFEEAKRLDPANPNIDQGLALLERAERQSTEEMKTQVQATFDCTELPDLSARLAACDRMIAAWPKEPKLQAKALALRAIAKIHARDAAGAVEDLDRAIALDPGEPRHRDGRIRALFIAERYQEALPGLQQLLAQNPYDDQLKSMVATTYYVQGDLGSAFAEFEGMRYWEPVEGLPSARAATIEAERYSGNDVFGQLAESASVPRWLSILGSYRSHLMSEKEFREGMEIYVVAAEENDVRCFVEFHVAHQALVGLDRESARSGFEKAVTLCRPGNFEYHAAKKWLLQLTPAT
jgi:tetratricopeptide (TPR) repeat protein